MKLPMDLEAREALQEMLDVSGGHKALMQAIDHFVKDQENQVLKYNLEAGPERLVILKARVEGAYQLRAQIQNLKPKTAK